MNVLANTYTEIANVWLRLADDCRLQVRDCSRDQHEQALEWEKMAARAVSRAAYAAQLARKHTVVIVEDSGKARKA